MKLHFITCMHGRHNVSELFLIRMCGLMKYAREKGHQVQLSVMATTGDSRTIDLLNLYDVHHDTCPNQPLGAKWNKALELFDDADYMVITGSDDLLLNSYIDTIEPYMEQRHAWGGLLNAYMLAHPGNAGLVDYQRRKVIGAGTFIDFQTINHSASYVEVEKWIRPIPGHYMDAKHLPIGLASYLAGAEIVELKNDSIHPRLWPDYLVDQFDITRDIRIIEATGQIPVTIHTPEPVMICLKAKESIRTWEYMKRAGWVKNDVPAETVLSLLTDDEREYWETNIKNK